MRAASRGLHRFELTSFLLISLAYIVAVVPAPGVSIPGAIHDDGLFMKWSVSILNGQWLGTWDVLTTSKGPLHSVLTAAAASIGINPFAYKRLFYLAGSLIFVIAALHKSPAWLKITTFTSFLLDPFQYGAHGLQNLREGTYIPLQIIAFGLGSLSLDYLCDRRKVASQILLPAIGAFFCFGLMLVTREARIIAWLEMATYLALAFFIFIRKTRFSLNRRLLPRALSYMLCVLVLTGIASVPMFAVGLINEHYYDARISNSTEEGWLPVLYGKILSIRVKGESPIPRVPAKKTTIQALIDESSDGSDLSYILKSLPSEWGQFACRVYQETCGEIGGGWFMWALRDGISASLGTNGNERSFQQKVQSASYELDRICRRTTSMECSPQIVGYMQPFSRWGFRRPHRQIGIEGKRILSTVFIPTAFPIGAARLDSRMASPIEYSLRINGISIPESSKWSSIFIRISYLGAVCKLILTGLAIATLGLALVRLKSPMGFFKLCDPVCFWLAFSLCLHIATYTLLGLTSFPGDPYTIMASSLQIGLVARLSGINIVGLRSS
jgi:hypothetical protein